jgi:hypothetical protein
MAADVYGLADAPKPGASASLKALALAMTGLNYGVTVPGASCAAIGPWSGLVANASRARW